MLEYRNYCHAAVLALLLAGAGAVQCGGASRGSGAVAQPNPSPFATRAGNTTVAPDMQVLADSGSFKVSDALVVVARDSGIYEELRKLGGSLPARGDDFFASHAVIAAFLGVRRTAGYSVEISSAPDGTIHISQHSPPPGSMRAQVLTSPLRIVSVPLRADGSLPPLELDDTWKSAGRPYRVASGEFQSGGSIAGKTEKLNLAGNLRVQRASSGPLATLLFDLAGTSGSRERALRAIATVLIRDDGSFKDARLDDDGSLLPSPHGNVAFSGQFAGADAESLSIKFATLPSPVTDGYSGGGRLSAVATGPPPPKRPSLADEP